MDDICATVSVSDNTGGTEMMRFAFFTLIFWVASIGSVSAQQPPEAQAQCATKYEAAKAAGTIGGISRNDFLRVCAVTTAIGPSPTGSTQLPAAPPVTTVVYTDPLEYCRAVGTIDRPDKRYEGPKVTQKMATAVGARLDMASALNEAKQTQLVWRCLNTEVLACYRGNNNPCEKWQIKPYSNTIQFCKQNPNAPLVPFAASGESTGPWTCVGTQPKMGQRVLVRGFAPEVWKVVR
jgi:hypothetical protein